MIKYGARDTPLIALRVTADGARDGVGGFLVNIFAIERPRIRAASRAEQWSFCEII